jgi:hypothetical protein
VGVLEPGGNDRPVVKKASTRRLLGALVLLTAGVTVAGGAVHYSNPLSSGQSRNFDEYGQINWEAEQAHLDNFAVQLMNDPELMGYIFVYDGNNICEGEAQARAIRAKTYLVNVRGVPWNRIIWRHDGYDELFMVALRPVNRSVAIPYPYRAPLQAVIRRHVTKGCRARIAEIKHPNT